MKLKKLIAISVLVILCFSSCRKEETLTVDDIPGLGGDTWVQGPIDKWVHDSLTTPLNIDVGYKWNSFALNLLDKNVIPVKEEIVIPVLGAIKRVWINTYSAEIGAAAFKSLVPKFLVLAGSGAYDYEGAIAGLAGGGRQIVLLELNYFRNKTMPGFTLTDTIIQKNTFMIVEHEFAHIFDQNKLRPFDFDKISQGLYSSDWINVGSNAESRKDGFITPYSSSKASEDFAEMVSYMLVEGKSGFDRLVNEITGTSVRGTTATQAKERLHQKEAIIVDYFKKSWNIDFYSLQARTRAAIEAEF